MDPAALAQEVAQLRADLDQYRVDQQNMMPNSNRVPEITNAVGQLQRHVGNLQDSGVTRYSSVVPMFSGSLGESFTDWFEMFTLSANGQQWDDDRRCIKLPMFLRGAALEVYKDQDAAIKANLAQLTEALRRRLEPDDHRRFISAELHGRRQLVGESANEFAQAIKKLLRTCYAGMGEDDRAMLGNEFFRNGLQKNIRDLLELRRPENFEAAITEAQIIEMNQRLNGQNRTVLALTDDEPNYYILGQKLGSMEQTIKDLSSQVSRGPKVMAAVRSNTSHDDDRVARLEARVDNLMISRQAGFEDRHPVTRFDNQRRSFANYRSSSSPPLFNRRNIGRGDNRNQFNSRNNETRVCYNCRIPGHLAVSCPAKRNDRNYGRSDQNYNQRRQYEWSDHEGKRPRINAITTTNDVHADNGYTSANDELRAIVEQNERLAA